MRKLSERVEKVHVSPIRKVAALLDETRERSDIISFGGGAPSVPPPEGFLSEFKRLISANPLRSFGYTGTRGIPELREAIANDVKKYGRVDYSPASEIILSTGATEGIFSIVTSIVDSGDEVIITDPTYLGYREMIEIAQGKPKRLPVNVENGYQPSVDGLKKLVSRRTKAVMILSPDNPTGRIIDEKFARALVDLAQDHNFWIVADDIYKHIIYEGEHIWISRFPGGKEHAITVCSFSKEASVPGLRVGYTLAPKQIIDAMEKMQQYSTLAPNSLGQFALVSFLRGNMKEQYLKNTVLPVYATRRELMGKMLQAHLPSAKTVKPAGAFYYFVDMRPYLSTLRMDEQEFATRLLKDAGVAVIPGRFFGDNGSGHVRFTFVSESEERIELGLKRISEFISRRST